MRAALLLLLLAGPASAAGDFLNLGVGARPAAMGEAYSAVVDEASALHWNPAALTTVEKRSAVVMHSAYLDTMSLDYGAFSWSAGRAGSFGAGFTRLAAGSITETDELGSETGTFSPADSAFSLGYARKLFGWSAGGAVKFVRSTILATARTTAYDAGLLSPELGRWRLAFTASNLGGRLRFEEETEELPAVYKAGLSYRIAGAWLAAADLALPEKEAALGFERVWTLKDGWSFAGRFGAETRTLSPSLGLGARRRGVAVDYAMSPLLSVGFTHRLSLSAWF